MTAGGHETQALLVHGLAKRFGAFTAVDAISFSVVRGSVFALLGPNGAGKTTTLRMLTGLLAPDAGVVRIDGLSLQADPVAVKRRIGVVPDPPALFERLSLWEQLTMVGRVYGLDAPATLARGEALLRLLDLWDDRHCSASAASHGMRKKLALAMALVHAPAVLFLDEPFEGMDPVAAHRVRDTLGRMARRGTTIVLTSHTLEIVERVADRAAILVHGRIHFECQLADLRANGGSLEAEFLRVADTGATDSASLSWLV